MAKTRNATFLLALLLALAAPPLRAQEPGIAARVNGVEISVFRLERYFEDYLRERGRNLATLRSPAAYQRLKRDALERLVLRELLVQEAARRGLAVADHEVAAARARLVSGYKTAQAFRRRLDEAGFSEAAFDDYLRQELAAERALSLLAQSMEPDAATPQQRVTAEQQALQALRARASVELLVSR